MRARLLCLDCPLARQERFEPMPFPRKTALPGLELNHASQSCSRFLLRNSWLTVGRGYSWSDLTKSTWGVSPRKQCTSPAPHRTDTPAQNYPAKFFGRVLEVRSSRWSKVGEDACNAQS